MMRIGSLICALTLLVFATPSHALTFQFSFGGVQGLISGLEDNSALQSADSVNVTASPIGGLVDYVPTSTRNIFSVSNGAMTFVDFFSHIPGQDLQLSFAVGIVEGGTTGQTAPVSYSLVAETPLPAALPLFATGLGALGLLTWRRKRKAVA